MGFQLRERDGRVHFSLAKMMSVSPAHAKHAAENKREATPAMRRGTAIDRLVFGGSLVKCAVGRETKVWAAIELICAGADYAVCDAGNRNAAKYKDMAQIERRPIVLDAEYQAAIDILGPRKPRLDEIVTPEEFDLADGAAASVLSDPVVRELGLLKGEQQRVIHWDMHGLPWAAGIAGEGGRGGFDVLGEDHIADLKATPCTEPIQWSRQARRMLYVEQLAAYREGARAIGRDTKRHYLIGVEVKPPFVVTVLEVPEKDLDEAARNVQAWCDKIRACESSGNWPGYTQAAWPLEPKSVWDQAEEAEAS